MNFSTVSESRGSRYRYCSRHPYLVFEVFGGTPGSFNRYKDQGKVTIGGTLSTSSWHPGMEPLPYCNNTKCGYIEFANVKKQRRKNAMTLKNANIKCGNNGYQKADTIKINNKFLHQKWVV